MHETNAAKMVLWINLAVHCARREPIQNNYLAQAAASAIPQDREDQDYQS